MLIVRPTAYAVPLAEQDFASLTPTVTVVNSGTVGALITGHVYIYRRSTGLRIFTSELRTTVLAAGSTADIAALSPWSPPAPADDDYFVMCDITATATSPHEPPGIVEQLGPFGFDIKPVGMGPAPAAHHATHELGGSDPIDCTGLPGAGGSGTDDHADLTNLDFASAGHTGFEATANKGVAGGYAGLPNPLSATLPLRADGTPGRPAGVFVEAECWTSTTSSGATLPWTPAAIASGTFSVTAGTPNHPGIVRLLSSTSANSGWYLLTYTAAILIAGNEEMDIILRPGTLAGTTIRAGLLDTASSSAPTDGAYMHMDPITGLVTGRTMSNTAGSTTGTSFQAITATWYRWRIVVNSDASRVDFYILDEAGAVLWTDNLTTNIPTAAGREVGSGLVATNSGTTALTLVEVDYMSLFIGRALNR
jgi:hypothetical protein